MEISSGSAHLKNVNAVQPQNPPVRAKEVENDKDKDDSAAKAAVAPSAPRPTVNTNGQVVGSLINALA